jgi:HNH endonuclease
VQCFYCTVELSKAARTRDHVIPLSKGGCKGSANVVPACKPCNGTKGSDDAMKFFDRKSRELGLSTNKLRLRRRLTLERIIFAGQDFIPAMLAERQAKHEAKAEGKARVNQWTADGQRLRFVAGAEAAAQEELAVAIGRRTRRRQWNVRDAAALNT